jgi:hypothetical protein
VGDVVVVGEVVGEDVGTAVGDVEPDAPTEGAAPARAAASGEDVGAMSSRIPEHPTSTTLATSMLEKYRLTGWTCWSIDLSTPSGVGLDCPARSAISTTAGNEGSLRPTREKFILFRICRK